MESYQIISKYQGCNAVFTVTKHLIICQLAIFGIEHSKFKIYTALQEQANMI